MPISIETFHAFLEFDRMIVKRYYALKSRFGGLKNAIEKAKIRKKDVRKEIDLYLGLLNLSHKETDQGIKEFYKWLEEEVEGLIKKSPEIPYETRRRMEAFKKKLRLPISDEEAINELLNIAEVSFRQVSKMEE